jgi:hypothetical protein
MKDQILKGKSCVYCGKYILEKDQLTRDHIPSVSLFPRGISIKNPAIIPSCSDCNKGFSFNEEWFRLFLVNLSQDKSFLADQMFDTKIKRSIQRKPQIGNKILENMEVVDYYSQAGIYLGKKTAIKLSDTDWDRYFNVLDKYIKGLYYHHIGERIENKGHVVKHKLIDPRKIKAELLPTLKFNFDNESVFSYAYAVVPSTLQSIFITTFYENITFMSFVASPEKFKQFEDSNNKVET